MTNASDSMRLVPVYLGTSQRAAWDPNRGNALELTPATAPILSAQPRDLLLDCHSDVARDLSEERGRDVATSVEGYRPSASIGVPKLAVGAPLKRARPGVRRNGLLGLGSSGVADSSARAGRLE